MTGDSFFNLKLMILPIILIIIAFSKWNSEKEFKSLKQRAKVNINVKGRMKDLD